MKKNKAGSILLITLMLLFFYLPIALTVLFSFNASRSLTHWSGFSLQWYSKLFQSRDVLASVKVSFIVAIVSTFVSTILGTLSAIALTQHRGFLKDYVMSFNNLPVMNPEIVTAISLMLLFLAFPFIEKGLGTMLIAHIAFSTPYVILTILPKLKSLDEGIMDAAMDLGANPFQALTKVLLPELTPAIISAALIAFTMSFDDFVISYFVTGKGVSNISILVYTMAKRINPSINALSTIMIAVIAVVMLLVNLLPYLKKKRKVVTL